MRAARSWAIWAGALAAVLGAAPGAAQVADASAVVLGLGGNATATARGLAALSLNPAGLGMPGGGVSVAVLPVQVRMGLHPVTLGDLADYDGELVPDAVKEAWLARVGEQGSQTGTAGVDVVPVALTIGRFGVQLSTVAAASMSLSPDIVELVLFGNAGRTGSPVDLALGGSELESFAVTTASASLGLPVALERGTMAVGATLKVSVGHVVAAAREQTGTVSSDPLEVDATFPIVATTEDADGLGNGAGVGLDVGVQLERGRWSFGASVLNLLNTFEWEADKLAFRAGTVFLDEDGSTTEFDEEPLANAPAELVDVVDDLGFQPIVSVGGAWSASDDLTLSADVRKRLGGGLAREPELHAGVGAEWHGLDALELRGGVAGVTGAVQLAAGGTLRLGPVSLSLAGALRRGERDADLGQLTLSFGGR